MAWTWKPALLCCALAALLPGRGEAAEPALSPEPAPLVEEHAWSHGVPAESRRAAEVLFKEGNALLKESIVGSAALKYREALGHWDHPNIHYNLALALMVLDQPVETHEHLLAAMKYGPEPLAKERFEHARNYLALLEKQLARVKVRCDVEGAQVALDGKPLFTPPGEYDGLVRAGRHTVVASKEGFVTNQSVRTLEGGTASLIHLPLMTMAELTTTRRRWSTWMPWSVVGAGAAVALAGGWLQYDAGQKVDWVDRESVARCPVPGGCASEPADLASARSRADTLRSASIGAYAVGGAAVAAGAVLLFLNRGQTSVLRYEDAPGAPPPVAALEVAPLLDPDRPGLVATLRF